MHTDAPPTEKNTILLFPETIISSRNSDQTIVTDVPIAQGTIFGPFPGSDAVEVGYNNWMEYATCVKDFAESNLFIGFNDEQLYFRCHRGITAGTELLVWGGNKETHSTNFTEWNKCKINNKTKNKPKKDLTYSCQMCKFSTDNMHKLIIHCNKLHLLRKIPEKNCQCPYCPHISTFRTNFRRHIIRYHGLFLNDGEVVTNKIVKKKKNVPQNDKINASSDKNTIKNILDKTQCNPTVIEIEDSSFVNQSDEVSSGAQKYKCKVCKLTFTRIRQLYGHMTAHRKGSTSKNISKNILDETQSNPTVIEIEDSSFVNQSDEVSSGVQKYKCKVCKLTFTRMKQLYGHMTAHRKGSTSKTGRGQWKRKHRNGIIDYKCSYCDKLFFTYQTRARHIRAIHLGIRFICSTCNKCYFRRDCLQNHIKHVHKSQGSVIKEENGIFISETPI